MDGGWIQHSEKYRSKQCSDFEEIHDFLGGVEKYL